MDWAGYNLAPTEPGDPAFIMGGLFLTRWFRRGREGFGYTF